MHTSIISKISNFQISKPKLFLMEKLNEYLQTLLSTSSYELHLEPNRNPYLVSSEGNMDITNTPLLGTQISMMVFPLIPTDVKQQLPTKPEVEFVHPHNLGDFNISVKKSPAGFNVVIRPMMNGEEIQNQFEKDIANDLNSQFSEEFDNNFQQPKLSNISAEEIEIEKSQKSYFSTPEIIPDEVPTPNQQLNSFSRIETLPVDDPQFTTSFSDNSNYEPPLKKSEFDSMPEIVAEQKYRTDFQIETEKAGKNWEASNDYVTDISYPQIEMEPPNRFASNSEIRQQSQPIKQNSYVSQSQPHIRQNYAPPIAEQVSSAAATANPQAKERMDALFYKMASVGSSDLHMSVSAPPLIRKDGKMTTLECSEGVLDQIKVRELLTSIMPSKNREEFEERNDTDFAYEIPGLARFRANIFMDRKGMGGVFRIIPSEILTAEKLGLSKAIMDLCNLSKGLVVVTGPTGSGKSTTLCAMVDSINKTREDHIITIEDPIEFTHDNQKCLVNQREVHNHTDSFKDALRAALREDPDILLVGEMRDLETISIAIETAETGHLVFGTLHTTTAASTIDRIIDQFPADRQQQIRVMLSESLKGVIAQTLLPKKGGGRVAALEVLIVTPAISNLIREGKTFQIPSAMQTGKNKGMVMLNDALFEHVQKGLVEPRDAYIKAVDKPGFESLLMRGGFKI